MTRARVALTATLLPLALAAALAGGCASGSSASAAASVPPTDGAGLVSVLCTQCHPPERVASAHKDRNGWSATIARMEAHGLQVTDQQRQSIIDYLTKRDGGS
ncbi:MAG: hypothetical protein P4L93_05985 [Coriobacteriia bacterium]|nr:hypothetical protein [Coriobacteriia bacterium]